jgi:CRP-like cAMP-binding protein
VLYFDQLYAFHAKYIHISREEFIPLFNCYEVKQFERKGMISREGVVEQYIHFIIKGIARKYFLKGKEEINTQFAKEGQVISSTLSFYSGEPSEFIVEAIEPVISMAIRAESLNKQLQEFPELEKLGRLMMTSFYLQRERWELTRLKLTTEERFIKLVKERPDLIQRVPQKYLATYLDIKPETFSRMKHILHKKISMN